MERCRLSNVAEQNTMVSFEVHWWQEMPSMRKLVSVGRREVPHTAVGWSGRVRRVNRFSARANWLEGG